MSLTRYIFCVSVLLALPPIHTPNLASPSFNLRPQGTATASADAPMRQFINALLRRDTKMFLAAFSRTEPFKLVNIIAKGTPYHTQEVSYVKLAADVRKREGLYWTFLERESEGTMKSFHDAFVDNVKGTGGRMWRRVEGNKYVRPDVKVGDAGYDNNYVKWRREGRRWVIAEIGYPQS